MKNKYFFGVRNPDGLRYIHGMIVLHASVLPMYTDCPRRAATKIILPIIRAQGYVIGNTHQSIGAAVGTGTHTAAAHLARVKMAGERPTEKHLADGVEQGIESFRKEIADGILYDTVTSCANEAEKQIGVLGASVLYEIIPGLEIVTAEPEPLKANIDGIEFTGRWDVEETDGIDDYKTGVKSRPAHSQLGGYSLLRSSYGKKRAERLTVFFLPRVPVKKTYPGTKKINYDVSVCEKAAFATIKHICRDIRNFEATKEPWVFPANPASMLCSRKYCAAWGTDWCEMGAGK